MAGTLVAPRLTCDMLVLAGKGRLEEILTHLWRPRSVAVAVVEPESISASPQALPVN